MWEMPHTWEVKAWFKLRYSAEWAFSLAGLAWKSKGWIIVEPSHLSQSARNESQSNCTSLNLACSRRHQGRCALSVGGRCPLLITMTEPSVRCWALRSQCLVSSLDSAFPARLVNWLVRACCLSTLSRHSFVMTYLRAFLRKKLKNLQAV